MGGLDTTVALAPASEPQPAPTSPPAPVPQSTRDEPSERELGVLADALDAYRDRYRESPGDAASLIAVGESPIAADMDPPELAAWTMIASTVLNLYRTTTQE